MITFLLLLILIGGFLLYYTSDKVKTQTNYKIVAWLQSHKVYSGSIGSVILIIVAILSINVFGVVSGLLFWLFSLSTILSGIIILTPIQSINSKLVGLVFLLIFLLEIML